MMVASRYFGCERKEPTDWSHGSQLICGVLPRRATAFSWRMLTGRRQSANHCTIEACALAVCSKRLTWLRSRGFHGMVAFLASAAAVTPKRRSPLLDHATGGTLACAGPVVWPTQTVGKPSPAAMTVVKAAVVAMRGAIAATTERRTS